MDVNTKLGHSSSAQRNTWHNSQWSRTGTRNSLPRVTHSEEKKKVREFVSPGKATHWSVKTAFTTWANRLTRVSSCSPANNTRANSLYWEKWMTRNQRKDRGKGENNTWTGRPYYESEKRAYQELVQVKWLLLQLTSETTGGKWSGLLESWWKSLFANYTSSSIQSILQNTLRNPLLADARWKYANTKQFS